MDDTTYDKRAKYNPGHGYEARKNAPISIVCHSTSNPRAKNTVFSAEATFLYNSTLVSAHYLIGKDGATVRFLEPRAWAAWHAGNAQREYQNQYSIGVELHHSVGDPPYPKAQMNALAVLLRSLMALFNIPVTRIETHGQIAIAGPYIRKSDPSDMTYEAFLQFRSTLVSEPPPVSPPKPPPQTKAYKVLGVPVYQSSTGVGALWGHLAQGEPVEIDATYSSGVGHLKDGRGFVDMVALEETQ